MHLAKIAASAALGDRERLRARYRAALDAGVPAGALLEATLQVFLFAGYPRTIDAFEELRSLTDEDAATEPPGDFLARGRALFARIYEGNAGAVERKLDALHPDFARFVLRDAYGQVMARPFLEARDRELMAVAMLGALRLRRQLQAHVRGALRCGASPEEIRAAAAEAPDEQRELVERSLA